MKKDESFTLTPLMLLYCKDDTPEVIELAKELAGKRTHYAHDACRLYPPAAFATFFTADEVKAAVKSRLYSPPMLIPQGQNVYRTTLFNLALRDARKMLSDKKN